MYILHYIYDIHHTLVCMCIHMYTYTHMYVYVICIYNTHTQLPSPVGAMFAIPSCINLDSFGFWKIMAFHGPRVARVVLLQHRYSMDALYTWNSSQHIGEDLQNL